MYHKTELFIIEFPRVRRSQLEVMEGRVEEAETSVKSLRKELDVTRAQLKDQLM